MLHYNIHTVQYIYYQHCTYKLTMLAIHPNTHTYEGVLWDPWLEKGQLPCQVVGGEGLSYDPIHVTIAIATHAVSMHCL